MTKARDLASIPAGSGDFSVDGGLYLGGTTAANYLDDYEEGDWTPALTGVSGAPTISYSNLTGKYIKIGAQVTVWARISVSTISGGASTAIIDNLPFTQINDNAMQANVGCMVDRIDADSRQVTVQGSGNSTYLFLIQDCGTTAGHTGLNITELNNLTNVRFMFTYRTSS